MNASEILKIKAFCDANVESNGESPEFCAKCPYRFICISLTAHATKLGWAISTMESFWQFILDNINDIIKN